MASKKKKTKSSTTKKATALTKTSSKKAAAKKAAKKPAKGAKKTAKKSAAKKPVAKKTAKKSAAKKPAKKAANKAIAKTKKTTTTKAPSKKPAASTDGPSTAMIVQHVFVPASPARVYRALTDPEEHGRFTGTVCTGAALVGHTYLAGSGYIHGKYLELVEGKRVVSEWRTTEWPHAAPSSKVEFDLSEATQGAVNGTELVMTHTLVPLQQAEDYRQGWIDNYWHPLRRHFAGG
jgi:uncharacterized protein YndB with AHSA1/START domain